MGARAHGRRLEGRRIRRRRQVARRLSGNIAAMGVALRFLKSMATTTAEALAEFAMEFAAGMQSISSGSPVLLSAPIEGANEQSPIQGVEALRSSPRGVSVEVAWSGETLGWSDGAIERKEQADGQ